MLHTHARTTLLLTAISFCAVWFMTPHAALSITNQQNREVRRSAMFIVDANATIVIRLKERKQLHLREADRHQKVNTPVNIAIGWLRRLRMVVMVG